MQRVDIEINLAIVLLPVLLPLIISPQQRPSSMASVDIVHVPN